jgi:hypothetical protein
MFRASFKIQSAGAIILAVIWATSAVAPAQGQAKYEGSPSAMHPRVAS